MDSKKVSVKDIANKKKKLISLEFKKEMIEKYERGMCVVNQRSETS